MTLFIPPAHGTAAPALDIALLRGFWHPLSPPSIPGPLSVSLFPCQHPHPMQRLLEGAQIQTLLPFGCRDPTRIFFPAWKKIP